MTSFALLLAALTLALTGVAHSWLGETWLIGPLVAAETRTGLLAKSGYARSVLRMAWHLTTLLFWAISAVFLVLAVAPASQQTLITLIVFSVAFFLAGTISFIKGRGRHLSWLAFLIVSGLLLVPLFEA